MFHAPTSDSKQQAGSTKANPSTPEQDWRPAFDGSHALGMPPIAGGGSPPPTPRRQRLVHLQRAYGNQAVLRMLERSAPAIQPKLVINEPGDAYEQEADRVADQVMRMLAPELSIAAAPPQVSRKCAACEEEKAQMLQTKPAGTSEAAAGEAPSIVHEVLRSPGHALDPSTRAFMEPRFAYDFGGVQIHYDTQANASARAVNAIAYTVGRHLVFSSSHYAPHTFQGLELLAHELAHVVQQSGQRAAPEKPLKVKTAGDDGERAADGAADAVMSGRRLPRLGSTPTSVQRQPAPGPQPQPTLAITSTVKKIPPVKGTKDGQLSLQLEITGAPCECRDLRWEQFAAGLTSAASATAQMLAPS